MRNTKKEILRVLGPVLCGDDLDSSLVLLCWGKADFCHIIPVRVENSADEASVWQTIRRAWYGNRGYWRERLPFFSVKEVSIVEVSPLILVKPIMSPINGSLKVSIAGLESRNRSHYVGTYTPEPLGAEKERNERIIADYIEQEFPCPYIPSTGRTCCLQNWYQIFRTIQNARSRSYTWQKESS